MKNQFYTNWASNEKEMCGVHRNIHQNNINVFIVLTSHLDNIFDVLLLFIVSNISSFSYNIFVSEAKIFNFKNGTMKIVMSHFDKITKKTRNSNTRNVKFELNKA